MDVVIDRLIQLCVNAFTEEEERKRKEAEAAQEQGVSASLVCGCDEALQSVTHRC